MSGPPALGRARGRQAASRVAGGGRGHLWWVTLVVGAIASWVAFNAKGGLKLEPMTATEMALTLGAGVLVAACVLLAPERGRVYGLWPTGLLVAFAMLTALSIAWSVQPDLSWQDSGRMLAYVGVFAVGVTLAHVAPTRWPAILGGLALASVVVCGYSLLTKMFPASLDPGNMFARENEPYGYWNAVGLNAAMGVVCCTWLGARRGGHALTRALAYPATGLLLVSLALAYSRGALVALAVGLLAWFCIVPLRLRSAALLLTAAVGAAAVVGWDFSRHALSSEGVPIAARTSAGHELGALILALLALLAAAGVGIGFSTARRAPSPLTRRRAGTLLLAGVALAVLVFLGALAHSQRGFTGTISHDLSALTNPNAALPPNTPGRLTAVASERARYWKEALQVFSAHPALGAGADGFATAHLHYETQTLEVKHAHGFIVQTLADLGLVGLLVVLALLWAWLAAAGRATHPFNRRTRYTPERVGMLAMLCVVITFGVHSFVDWTWYVPGVACMALLCAGWLAGRGPLVAATPERGRPLAITERRVLAALVLVAALLAAWSEWQPQRSEEARQQALATLERDPYQPRAALPAAEDAVSRDPLSVEALFALATVQEVSGQTHRARATFERAVRLQPSNPQTWMMLGRFQVASDPAAAVKELQAAIYLDPQSISPEAISAGVRAAIEVHNVYIQALEAAARQRAASAQSAAAHRAAAALKSARESRSRAALAARRAGQRRSAPRSTRSRTRRAAP
jgi:hypothetical protein